MQPSRLCYNSTLLFGFLLESDSLHQQIGWLLAAPSSQVQHPQQKKTVYPSLDFLLVDKCRSWVLSSKELIYDSHHFSICLKFLFLKKFCKKQFCILAQLKSPREDLDWSCLGHMACTNLIALTLDMAHSDWLGLDHGLILSQNASPKASCLAGEISPQKESKAGGRNQKEDEKACWENRTIDPGAVVFELLELKGSSRLTHAKCNYSLVEEKAV